MSKYLPTTILKCKDVEILCGVGTSKAREIMSGVRELHKISFVTYSSFCAYLGLKTLENVENG